LYIYNYIVATCPSQPATIPTNSTTATTTNPNYWTTTGGKYEYCKCTANYSDPMVPTTNVNYSKNYSTTDGSKTSDMVTTISSKSINVL